MWRNSLFLFLLSLLVTPMFGQSDDDAKNQFSPMRTAIPSLTIAPDARGGSMGDNGAATLPDINSQHWNPSKYAFIDSKAGFTFSYTPWLRKLINDIGLSYASGYYKLGSSERSAIGASLRYFSLGEVAQRNYGGQLISNLHPYEVAVDLSYSMKLSDNYAMGVAMRYIRSDMGANAEEELQAANGFSADISGYLEKYVYLGSSESLWSLGYNISNIGTKISFNGGNTQEFLPTNLKLGTGILYPLDEYNQLGIYLDLNKYLVPSYPIKLTTEDQESYDKRLEEYNALNSISGIFRSFSDATGGLSEELKEINFSLAAEYSYNSQFFVRGGYYYENRLKGNRQYFSAGAGFRMTAFQLDAAYLISTVANNPLDQTLRFSLSFDMDGLKNLFE